MSQPKRKSRQRVSLLTMALRSTRILADDSAPDVFSPEPRTKSASKGYEFWSADHLMNPRLFAELEWQLFVGAPTFRLRARVVYFVRML
jgi:hypothetical protein